MPWFGDGFGVDDLESAGCEGGVRGEEGAGFCDLGVALVATLCVYMLYCLAHCVVGMRKGWGG